MKKYIQAPSRKWAVKFEHQDKPIEMTATSKYQLKQLIAKRYAFCPCGCEEEPEIENIEEYLRIAL